MSDFYIGVWNQNQVVMFDGNKHLMTEPSSQHQFYSKNLYLLMQCLGELLPLTTMLF